MDEEISYDAACMLERIGKSTSFQEPVLISNQSRLPKFVSIAITCYVKHEFYKQHNEWTKGLVSEFDDPPLALPCVAEENLFDENVDPTSHGHLFSALAQVEDDPEFRKKLAALIIRNARMAVLGHQVSMEEEEEEDKVRILCNIRKLHEVTFVMFGQEESDDNLGMLPTDVRALNLLEAVELEADDDCNEEEEEDCCTICLEQLISASCIDAAAAARMPCGHLFHDGCIRKWLAQSHYCPICRFEMPKAGSES